MIKGLHHIAITTQNLEALVVFYKTAFSAEVVREGGWIADNTAFNAAVGLNRQAARLTLLRVGAAHLEIFEFEQPAAGDPIQTIHSVGLTHIGFEVTDIHAEVARLKDLDVPFFSDVLTGPAGGSFVYGRDPDGNIIELVQSPPEV